MSDILNKIPLIDITAPELNQSNYGSDLSQTFENIDKNFSTLANYDFIKGESGKSVIIEEVPFYNEDGSLNKYGHKVKEYFITKYGSDALKSIYDSDGNEISLYDNFTKDNAGNLYIISMIENDTTNESTPISSLYYVFLDGRFANSNLANIDEKLLADIDDLSCLLIYDKHIDGFKSLEGAFPTIYYEQDRGLCWNINGKGTGLQIRGINGKDGKSAELRFVECEQSKDNSIYKESKVISIYDYPVMTPVNELSPEELLDYDNAIAVILIKNDQEQKHYLYFGKLKCVDEGLHANYFDNMELTYNLQTTNLINVLKKINILSNDSNPLRGIFIPINNEPNEPNQKQSVHLLTTNSITGGNSDLITEDKVDVMFTGIDDIDTLTKPNEDKQLLVEKYLYVKVNIDRDFFTNPMYIDIPEVLEKQCSKYNYVLKYKLSDKIIKFDALDEFKLKAFGKINLNGSKISFTDGEQGNIKYKNPSVSNSFYEYNEHYETLPADFKSRMQSGSPESENDNALGVYVWELCDAKHSFDNDIINTSDENQLSYSNDLKNYFGHILTTTINPNISTRFVWFNGLELSISTVDNGKYVLYGWNENPKRPMFSFEKFVPIFNNDFRYNGDTSLNINYNINITGDEESPNRNVTVNGALNVDDINIYNTAKIGKIENVYTERNIITDAGINIGRTSTSPNSRQYNCTIDKNGNARFEKRITAENLEISDTAEIGKIKDVYTENDIITDAGIKIGKKTTNPSQYNCTIDKDGNAVFTEDITAKNLKINEGINSNNITSSNITSTNNSTFKNVTINSSLKTKNDRLKVNINTDSSLNIDATDVKTINISRHNVESVIKSNMTSLYTNSSGVVVSNDEKNADSKQFYCYGKSNGDNLTEEAIEFNHDQMKIDEKYEPIDLYYKYIGDIESFNPKDGKLIDFNKINNPDRYQITYKDGSESEDSAIVISYNKYFIQKHVIKQPNKQTYYDSEYWPSIHFGYFSFVLCIRARGASDDNIDKAVRLITKDNCTKYGESSNNYSYVKLCAYYKKEDGSFVKCGETDIMPLPTPISYLNDDINNPTDAWYGVRITDNNTIDRHHWEKRNNGWYNSSAEDRYQGYVFKPKSITLWESTHEVFRKMFNDGKNIEIYVRPEINIIIKSPNGNDKIDGMYVYSFVPLGNNINIYSRAVIEDKTVYVPYTMEENKIEETYNFQTGYVVRAFNETGSVHPTTWSLNTNTELLDSYFKYKIFTVSGIDNKLVTNICSDGIVIRDKSNIFGLGNIGSSPSLFYCDTLNKSSYNKGLRYIKLDDLFDTSPGSQSPLIDLVKKMSL